MPELPPLVEKVARMAYMKHQPWRVVRPTGPLASSASGSRCVDPASARYIGEVDAEARFRRSDHGMTKRIPIVSDEVKLRIKVNAERDH